MDIYRVVGSRIRAHRLHQGLTIEELSELAQLHPSYIGQVERGCKKMSVAVLGIIAEALGLSPAELFAREVRPRAASLGQLVDAASRGSSPGERRIILDVARILAKGLRGSRG